ncbi:MAG: hypothetical protein IKA30_05335 [Alphaproteobacteria bacterium]|nr:hypothetical protein [Alphaproteobacteria bacterium]
MYLRYILVVILAVVLSFPSFAQETDESAVTEEAPEWKPNPKNNVVLDEITAAIGDSAIKNITDSEQVFCYQIANKPENYTGYTIDGMALVGFCGVINQDLQDLMKYELFMNPDNILFDETEDCMIRPQVMLRFFRGVDSTDILLSSPCHAVAIFYGGKIAAFNAKPASQIIDAIVDPLIKSKVDFASPALFNQLLPVGVAQNESQKQLQEEKNAPVNKWQKKQEEQAAKRAGWNKLKTNQ